MIVTMAAAAVVYLSCSVDSGPVQFAVDEPNQQVTTSWPRYKLTRRDPALFDASSVTVNGPMSSTKIDRSSLAIEVTTRLPLSKTKVEHGACQLAEAPADRKF